MNPRFIFAGLVLILLAVIPQQVLALEPSCNEISINTYSVRVTAGNTVNIAFLVTNNSAERFFIDTANAYDNSTSFNVETDGYDREIRAGESGQINVSVKGRSYNEGIEEFGYIEFRGHFLGGNTCTLDDTTVQKFRVFVDKQEPIVSNPPVFEPNANDCRDIDITVPETLNIEGNGNFDVTIDNRTDFRVNVRIFAENVNVNPTLISIPKNTKITENIAVTASENGKIRYFVESPFCSFEKETVVNAVPERTLRELIGIGVNVIGKTQEFEAIVRMQNLSENPVYGEIGVNAPANWSVVGNTIVELQAFETKEFAFKITPDKALTEDVSGSIEFLSNGEKISIPIEFKKQETENPIFGTMFALLGFGASGLTIGLIALIVILIIGFFLLAFYSRKQKKPIVLVTKPKEVRS
ncbi:MAG: hypothetical protein JW772_00280 [Candidatus Diapherotrites archaeon]|nr:hypothetical protein [Candidatus Diapherotrites archaeon]